MATNFTTCEAPGCVLPGTFKIVTARDRTVTNDFTFCPNHASAFWDQYPLAFCSEGKTSWTAADVACDLEVVVCDFESSVSRLYLRECDPNGGRCVPITSGAAEAMVIIHQLRKSSFGRPLTHNAMCDVIHALGATLQCIIIDTLDFEKKWYEAKLRITDRSGADCIVDVRPSDAIALALTDNAPIYVSSSLLYKLGPKGNG